MQRRIWFERRFELGIPAAALPDIVERLRGTPARLAERVMSCEPARRTRRVNEGWSVLEHAGHLADLESLWEGRLDDFRNGAATLRPADLENRATWNATHNQRPAVEVLTEFRLRRERLVARVEALGDEEITRAAQHPRLDQPMTVVDLLFFVAEHDDHHLAAISALSRRGS